MKGKYIAIAASVIVLGGMGAFIGVGCGMNNAESDGVSVGGYAASDEDNVTQAVTGCAMCADGCAGACGECVGEGDMTCLDCVVCYTCPLCYFSGEYDSCMKELGSDESVTGQKTVHTLGCDISSEPLAGTQSYSVITVKLDYALSGDGSLSDAHIHSRLELGDGRTISAAQAVGDVEVGQDKSAEFKFYVERDTAPEDCVFSYGLYGND